MSDKERSTDGPDAVEPTTAPANAPAAHRRGPTSRDVAKRAGVSRTVVSFVLNNRPHTGIPEETRQRVLQAVADLGYRPNRAARSLVSGSTRAIGVVVSETRNDSYGDTFLPALLRSIDGSARAAGYRVVLEYIDDRRADNPYLAPLREGSVDGLLICGPRPDDQALSELGKAGAPAVVIGDPGASGCASVDVDNAEAARAAVAHLLGHGYRRIGMISNVPLTFASSRARLDGFRRALAEANLPPDDRVAEGGLEEDSGRRAMESLLGRLPRPDAVFAASDQVAISAMATLQGTGLRVPLDVALIGFDDLPFASRLHPPLSTVHVPAAELGRIASQRLIDLIDGRTLDQSRLILPTKLVLRQSCGEHATTGGA